ncbi:conserved protein of unknown function [Pseudomonas putida KT2440]|jgi:hypothetical protein|uniref:Uncharacterized protein n=1 Tax=Pseudomonas putida (strain ATCC 47054 / DSM 6125 / CFBP 8728 / NCIMB 11950 / KT2440) TaxID=160488 RepID=Q88JX4_PSEPK|nr:conserved protein of unknown function [Pseudomonas putida KT2440]
MSRQAVPLGSKLLACKRPHALLALSGFLVMMTLMVICF